jgi:hypothetical protein
MSKMSFRSSLPDEMLKCLLYKHEDLSSDPGSTKKKKKKE